MAGPAHRTDAGRARRAVALAVLVAAAAALVATSPLPDSVTFDADHTVTVELEPDAPRVVGRLTLDISAPTLPPVEVAPNGIQGRVSFDIVGGDSLDGVAIRAVSLEVPAVAATEPLGATFDLADLCAVGEDCNRSFEITLDDLGTPGAGREVRIRARVAVTYERLLEIPDGAAAAWEQPVAFTAGPAGPTVTADLPLEELRLDAEHPAALRVLNLIAAPSALDGRTSAWIEADAQGEDVRITVTERDQVLQSYNALFDPFATCDPAIPCSRPVVIRFELRGGDVQRVAAVAWAAHVRAGFPDADGVPAGADVSVSLERSADAGPDDPRLSTTLSGRIAADDEEGMVRLRGEIPPAALRVGGFTGDMVPVLAIFTLSAAESGQVQAYAGESVKVQLGGGGGSPTSVLLPIECQPELHCSPTMSIDARNYASQGRDVLPLDWTVELRVLYPTLDAAPPSRLSLRVLPDTR